MALVDKYNRKIDYLRIGVTDRCNLRCRYCMPAEGIDFSARKELLSYEEIIRLALIFKELGVKKVRLTGGEPFIRKDIGTLLTSLSSIFPSVHITTNASFLKEYVDLLSKLKISGLNISLDTLDQNRFFSITRRDAFKEVMENINLCISAGIPIKINMVTMKGINDDEILDFIAFGIKERIEVRFIEAMPFNDDDGNKEVFISASDIIEKIKKEYPQVSLEKEQDISSAQRYLIPNFKNYRFGVIPAYTRSLCGSCNRIRLSPKGKLLNCLYSVEGEDLKALMRCGCSDTDLKGIISKSVYLKKATGFDEEELRGSKIFESMTTIGG